MLTQVIEVAIGLSYTFLVLSLLCSAAREMVAAGFQTRSKVLIEGVLELLQECAPSGTWSNLKGAMRRLFRFEGGFGVEQLPAESLARALLTHPLVAGLAQKGRMPSYIPPQVFTRALMDVLARSHGRGLVPEHAATHLIARMDPKLAGILRALLSDGEKSAAALENALQYWFNSVMDRVSGWYKRRTQLALFLVGLFFAVSLNVDAIELTQRMWSDRALTAELVVKAQAAAAKPNGAAADAKPGAYVEELKKLPIGWPSKPIQDGGLGILLAVAGWLISAFAASLGAPFWFQGMSRLLALRSSGVKPDEAPVVAPPQAAAGAPAVPPAVVTAVASPAAAAETEAPVASGTSTAANAYEQDQLTPDDIRSVQEALGMSGEQRTGYVDDGTRSRIVAFQESAGMEADGKLSRRLVKRLLYPGI